MPVEAVEPIGARAALPERPCPVCGTTVEPLRAREVLLFEDGFRFLCDADCRAKYLHGERDHDSVRAKPKLTPPIVAEAGIRPARAPVVARPQGRAADRSADRSAGYLALHGTGAHVEPPPWLGLGLSAGALVLAGFATNPYVAWSAVIGVLAACALALHAGWPARARIGWVAFSLPALGAALAALAAALELPVDEDPRAWLAGAAIASGTVVLRVWLDRRSIQPIDRLVAALAAKMPPRVRVPKKSVDWETAWEVELEAELVETERVRSGQEVVALESDVLGVDGVIQAGQANVLLHPSSRTPVPRGPGDPVIAGARVLDGAIRVLAIEVGQGRALVRPRSFGAPHARSSARLTRTAHRIARWGGLLVLAGIVVGLAFATGAGLAAQLSAAAAVMLAAPLVAIRRASVTPYVSAAASAAERGISFESARALERAGRATVAALCTHGTITEGEPEVEELRALGGVDWDRVLSLIAGSEAAAVAQAAARAHGGSQAPERTRSHPIARGVAAFARARGVLPAAVRRARSIEGRGVTALGPASEELVIGSRALLLAEGVSIAVADADAARHEERGHRVVFVGIDGRARAVLSLRDDDRLGARAAVQRLIDLGIEIVLLSGDHRGTVEALARRLDIAHLKAELLPDERAAEVRRLRETGGIVAAVGRAGDDDVAVAAAHVPVRLDAAGLPQSEGEISLTADDVRDAAAALWLARAARREAWRGTTVTVAAGVLLVGLAATGVAFPAAAALLALALDAYALPGAVRLLRRIELRLPARG